MASVSHEGDFVIDEEELCDYISETLRLNPDTVSLVLDAEMMFLETKGLVVEETSPGKGTLDEVPMNEIDRDELIAYVLSKTGLDRKLVKSVLDTELKYLDKQGGHGIIREEPVR